MLAWGLPEGCPCPTRTGGRAYWGPGLAAGCATPLLAPLGMTMAASVVTDRANAVRQYDRAHLQRHNTRTRRACAVYPAGLRSLLRPSASPGGARRGTDACLDCWRGGVGTKRQLRPGRKAVITKTEAPLSAAFAANRSTGNVAPALACTLPTKVAEKVEAGLRSAGLEDLSAEEAS